MESERMMDGDPGEWMGGGDQEDEGGGYDMVTDALGEVPPPEEDDLGRGSTIVPPRGARVGWKVGGIGGEIDLDLGDNANETVLNVQKEVTSTLTRIGIPAGLATFVGIAVGLVVAIVLDSPGKAATFAAKAAKKIAEKVRDGINRLGPWAKPAADAAYSVISWLSWFLTLVGAFTSGHKAVVAFAVVVLLLLFLW